MNKEKQRARLISLLEELFQLDKPDLDFGFYKIMHAKAGQVSDFLQNDLLDIIEQAFGKADEAAAEETRLAYEAALKQAKEYGAQNPEETEPVKKAKAAYDAAKDSGSNEGEVYEHLYRFFERYYDGGDFMSRRYFARETDGKAAPYAVPYDGREVYLHWANRDQYYIKTSEYLSNCTFDLSQAQELKNSLFKQEKAMKLHCRIIEAAEGEHNNVKASEKTERFFLIHEEQPVLAENGELVLQFEYRPDPEKSGTSGKWQEKRLDEAEEKILHALTGMKELSTYNEALRTEIDADDKKNKRTLLRKYLNKYSARNTMDYFIHKDLGGFLRRELDFYIKNEVMRLDDLENADAPRVESYLAKIKVLREVARHLIAFLAQLEEFQKKLWLKKKFVTETQYCITLDRISEDFYAEIAQNDAQRAEWVKLFAIDGLDGYSEPLTTEFLKENPFLVLDTAFFETSIKDRLLAETESLDENTEGLLMHSENFHALRLMREKYFQSVKCVYIDPPYNTGKDSDFYYKDRYQHSSWLAMMKDKLSLTRSLLTDNGSFYCQLDYNESARFKLVADDILNFEREIIWSNESSSGFKAQANTWIRGHDTIYFYSKSGQPDFTKQHLELAASTKKRYDKTDLDTGEKYKEYTDDDGNVRKVYLKDSQGKPISTIWTDIIGFQTNNAGREHIAFSTQKPTPLIERVVFSSSVSSGDYVLDYFMGSGTTAHAVIKLNRADQQKRKYIGIEVGDYFEYITCYRIKKNIYSKDWKDNKPVSREGISHAFKYLRLESYEDALNNLAFRSEDGRDAALAEHAEFRRDYMLKYWLDFETKNSPSLLNIEGFADPCAYHLKVKKPGTEEYRDQPVDLIETFNWLIGLHVDHMDMWRGFTAAFKREADPELPQDTETRLVLDGALKEDDNGKWRFRKIEGRVCRTPGDKSNMDRILIIWRNLTGNLEEDNLMLDEWFKKYRLSAQDSEFDVIYVNGSNNLTNIKRDSDAWKVVQIEETFHQKMWDVEE